MKFQKITSLVVFVLLVFNYALAQNKTIRLYEGSAPGSESWEWNEEIMKMGPAEFIYNIVDPELIVFEAKAEIATGQAVVVCPGGGFHFLSMKNEGYDVAKWLNEKGITAFVLKYRTEHCLTDNPMQEFMQKQPNTDKFNKDIEPVVGMAIEDGKAAVSYVREHAAEWNLKADEIGIMGFSAGGTVTAGVAFKYDEKSRPNFAAPIYPYVGSFGNPVVPDDAPAIFIAAATDDTFGFQTHCTRLYNAWTNVGKSAELHIYRKGGHGFGMQKQNAPTDMWIDRFYEWLTNIE
ncbi:alpha/beta hydrolase [Prolixibacteraceae bacterium Z1-6]|uniref:Alpha/beta hydrolase n=1 Tax=Draconibacterium aestuarii TaxID=2998507 RepID=A0A9X3J7G2_9BACT|nr:alpha/beta hydrolase [Prolixibacteraceae bacterium Z1-6]